MMKEEKSEKKEASDVLSFISFHLKTIYLLSSAT
jgi:hypothetical protein